MEEYDKKKKEFKGFTFKFIHPLDVSNFANLSLSNEMLSVIKSAIRASETDDIMSALDKLDSHVVGDDHPVALEMIMNAYNKNNKKV